MADIIGSVINTFYRIIGAILISAFIVAIYPQLSTYLGNGTVFLLGSLGLFIIGVLPLIYILKAIQQMIDDITNEVTNRGGFQ